MELREDPIISKSFLLEEINVDINDILKFTFNIDNLKIFLSSLLKNQTILSHKILELEQKIKDKQIDSEQNESKILKYINPHSKDEERNKNEILQSLNSIKNKELTKEDKNLATEKNEKKENKENKVDNYKEIDKDEKEGNKENSENDDSDTDKERNKKDELNLINKLNQIDIKNNIINKDKEFDETDNNKNIEKDEILDTNREFVMNNYEIYEFNNKLKTLQKKIKNLELLNKVNKFTSNLEENKSEDIQMIKMAIKDLKSETKNLKQENEEFKKKLENINLKFDEINIIELFKQMELEEGSIGLTKGLIVSLEQKFFKKTDLMDQRYKKLFSDFLDLKNNLQNVINKNGVMDFHLNEVRNNFKNFGELYTKNNNENTTLMNNIENKMNNLYKDLFTKYDEKNNKIESNIIKINDRILNLEKFRNENMNLNNINNNNLELNEETLKWLDSINNHINDIENKINSILQAEEFRATKEDILKLENDLSKKSNAKDYYDLKKKYNIQLAKTNSLEENIEKLQDISEKNSSELIFYTKKIESLTSNVLSIKAQMEILTQKEEKNLFELSKYLEKIVFNKYINSTLNEKKKIENNFEELRKIINEMSNIIKTKCNSEDLKVFENIVNKKFEEIKLISNRRFADKVDTNKSMKYLDTQIRHIIDVYIKRMDKNDSWLIAKKPIGGFSCASCESYLGELKNKGNYLPWNKYPQREKDVNYRVGNGFSRMLNMLNIELKNNELHSIEKGFESDDEITKNSEDNRFKARIKNSSNSYRDIFKEKMNKINNSSILKNNSFLNKSNLPKIYNKNEESSIIENNNNIEVGIGPNGDENINKENKETNIEHHPHIIKIFKKLDHSRTERPSTYNNK